MTPDEEQLFHLFGRGLLGNLILFTVSTLLYGCYLCFVPASIRILAGKTYRSGMTLGISLLLLVIFLVNTLFWATYVVDMVNLVRIVLVDLPGNDLVDQLVKVTGMNDWILRYQEWPLNINFIICDAIVVWRVYVILSHPMATFVTGSLLFADVAASLAWGIASTVQPDIMSTNIAGSNNVPAILKVLSWTASLLTNAIATGLIAVKAWSYRRLLTQGFAETTSTPVSRALWLLVESGAAFMLLQLIIIILNSITYETLTPPEVFMRTVNRVAIMLTAIYPTLVLIIVDRQRSLAQVATQITSQSTVSEGPHFTQFTFASDSRAQGVATSGTLSSDTSETEHPEKTPQNIVSV